MNLKFAWINVKRNAKGNAIIIAVMSIGMIALMFAYGFIQMSFEGLRESSIRRGIGHIQITHPREKLGDSEYTLEYGISPKQQEKIRTILEDYDDDIEAMMPRVNFSGIASMGEKTTVFLAKGIDVKNENAFASVFIEIKEGRNIGEDFDNPEKDEVIIGVGLAKILRVKVGDEITLMVSTVDGAINAIDVPVSGLFSTGIPEVDQRMIMSPLKLAQSVLRTDKISKLVVGLYETDKSKEIYNAIKTKIASFDEKPYHWLSLAPFYEGVVNLYNIFLYFLGGLIALVSISSVAGSVYNSVIERTHEIGMLKANGFSNKSILQLIITETAIVTLFGFTLAFIVGHGTMFLVNQLGLHMPPPPGSTQGYPLQFFHEFLNSTLLILIIVAAAILSAIKPALYAAKLPISEALRK